LLLRHLAHDCRLANASLTAIPVAGMTNTIADLLSRSFHLSDDEMLRRVQLDFPVQPPWKLVTPPATLTSTLNSALLNRLPAAASPDPVSPAVTQPGLHGPPSATPCTKIHGSQTLMTRSLSYKSMLIDTAWARWLPPGLRSRLERWRQPFVPWGRRTPHWAFQTRGCKTLVD
jgi:hypothetical protein